jgi:hypothetical protein
MGTLCAPLWPREFTYATLVLPVDRFLNWSVNRTSVRYMGTGAVSDREAITAVLDRFEAVQAELAALSFDALTELVLRARRTPSSRFDLLPYVNRPVLNTGVCGRGVMVPQPMNFPSLS